MATAIVDLITDVSAEEDKGYIVSLTRVAHISGITGTEAATAVAQMLAATNLPASGDSYTIGASTLYVTKRSPKMLDDTGHGLVTLGYERIEPPGTPGDPGNITFSGGTTAVQISTEVDKNGAAIVVQNTWSTNPNLEPDEDHRGRTDRQGGVLSTTEAQSTLTCTIIEDTNTPGVTTEIYGNKLNSQPWNGSAARRWLCMSATFEAVDLTRNPKRWRFTYQFQKDRFGWDERNTVFFVDPRTNKPIPDPIPGVSQKQVQWYDEVDFRNKFGP